MAKIPWQRARLFLGFFLAGLIASVAMSYQTFRMLAPGGHLNDDDYGTVFQIERTLSLITDAETGQRGFLLTGDVSYLEQYREAVPRIEERLERMTKLTANDPVQRARIAGLRCAITVRVKGLQKAIDLRRQKGLAAALEVVRTNQGKQAMDLTRSLLATMRREEERRRVLQVSLQSGLSAFCLTTLMCYVLFMRFRGGAAYRPGAGRGRT